MILNKINAFILSFSLYILTSCVHDTTQPVQNINEISHPYPSNESKSPVVELNYSEILPYLTKSKDFLWNPFILPVEANYEVEQSHLLLGYQIDPDNFIFPPQKGSCLLIKKGNLEENKNNKLVKFKSLNPFSEMAEGEIFLLLNFDDLSPYAILRFNRLGESQCNLPKSSYYLSYKYGSFRKDFPINTEDKSLIKVDYNKKGVLNITPSFTMNVVNGDLIRIGRKIQTENKLIDMKENSIPIQIENDLYRPSNSMSQKMGVDEILQTTILVGNNPFHIRLNQGQYSIAILRKNNLVCIKEVEIEENKAEDLFCPKGNNLNMEQQILSNNNLNISFDTTFYPERLNQNSAFQKWFIPNENFIMPNRIKDTRESLAEKNQNNHFTFLFQPSLNSETRELNQNFNFKINDKNSPYPIFGTDLKNIVNGAIPYSSFTSIQLPPPLNYQTLFSSNSIINSTNGVNIKLFEPILNQDGMLSSSFEQRFRFWIYIPSWNSTNVIEMDVDGKLYRRWILDRGDVSLPFSTTLSEKTNEKKQFHVQFFSWGQEPLPDFLYGTEGQMPFSRTQNYTVTMTGS